MKKGFLRLLGLLMLIPLFAACDVHEFPYDEPDEPVLPTEAKVEVEVDVNFDLTSMPWLTTVLYNMQEEESRANADLYDIRYQVFIYGKSKSRVASRTPIGFFTFTFADIETLSRTLEIKLEPGEYDIRVWVDFVDKGTNVDKYYDTSDLTSITLKLDNNGYVPGNTHYRNAFLGNTTIEVPKEALALQAENRAGYRIVAYCEMDRPLARFEFITTDLNKFLGDYALRDWRTRHSHELSREEMEVREAPIEALENYRIRVRYTGYMPSIFNFYTNRPVDSFTGMSFIGKITPQTEKEALLGFDYVFVNGAEASIDVALDLFDLEGNRIASTDPIHVPLQRNHYTVIKGAFLSAQASGGVGIDPGFDGEYNIFFQ